MAFAVRARRAVVAAVLTVMAGCGVTEGGGGGEAPRALGQEIVVTGAVQRTIDAVSFVVETEGDVRGLLVVAPSRAVRPSQVVEVRGVVRRFDVRAVEGEVRIDLDDARYEDFDGVDFVHADQVVVRR